MIDFKTFMLYILSDFNFQYNTTYAALYYFYAWCSYLYLIQIFEKVECSKAAQLFFSDSLDQHFMSLIDGLLYKLGRVCLRKKYISMIIKR